MESGALVSTMEDSRLVHSEGIPAVFLQLRKHDGSALSDDALYLPSAFVSIGGAETADIGLVL